MTKAVNNILLGLVLLFTSCLKQDAPKVNPDYDSVVGDSQRLDSCTNVNFNRGFLERKNIIDLFVCTRWQRRFPTLFDSINEMPEESWNHVMGPVDKVFFDNEERRDRMIEALKELDRKSALDGLGSILTSLNETNFYDAFNELFVCADDPSDEVCSDRSLVLSKDEIQILLRGLNRSPDFFVNLEKVFAGFVYALGPHKDELKNHVRGFYDWPEFQEARLFLVNRIFEEFEDGLEISTIQEWRGLLTGGIRGESHFLREWFNASYMNADRFNFLMTYPILERPKLVKEHLAVEQAVDEGMICTPSSENNYLEIDVQKELQTLMRGLRDESQIDFMFYLSQKALLLRSAETFCPIVRDYQTIVTPQRKDGYVYQEKYSIDFVDQLQATSDLIVEQPFFDFLKFLETNSHIHNLGGESGFILLDIITEPYAQQFIKMNEKIIQKSPSYNKIIFEVLRGVPLESYDALDRLLAELEEDPRLRLAFVQLAKAWDFYSQQEKNFLFTFLDKHMEEDIKYYALFQFYLKTLRELPEFAVEVQDQWFQDERQEDRLYQSLKDFTWLMSGADVLRDFKSFFSRDHIIEIIKVITRGGEIKSSQIADSQFMDAFRQSSHQRGYQLSLSTDSPMAAYKCLNEVLSDEASFYRLLVSLPPECQDVSSDNITIEYFSWMNNLGELLNEYTGNPNQGQIFFSSEGLFSPRLAANGVALADSLDETLQHGVNGLFEDVAFHLFEKKHPYKNNQVGFQSTYGDFVRSLWTVLSFQEDKSELFRNKLLKQFAGLGSESHHRLWSSVGGIWEGYGDYLAEQDEAPVVTFSNSRFRFPCHMFLNQNVGYRCPQTAQDILDELFVAVDILGRSYDEETTPLGNILVAASSDHGQPIPLNSSDARPYRLSLTETFKIQSDLTDKKRDINNLMIPYEKVVDGGTEPELLTTMERVEVVIRDVSFRYNYLGVQYLNSVSQGDDYNDDVESRKKLMEKCIKIPIIRCGKKMTNDQQRRGENALEAYDGLLDVNNGRGLEPDFQYGNYMKALLSAIVGSSDKEAQEVRFFPLGEDVLKKHNGLLLGSLTRLAGFTHLGRWIQARFISSDQKLEELLESRTFKLIDRTFLKGIPERELQELAMRLTETLNTKEGQTFLTDLMVWLFNQNDQDLDALEKTLGRTMGLLSQIAPFDDVFQEGLGRADRFSENSWMFLLDLAEFGIRHWPEIKNAVPMDFDLNAALLDSYHFIDYLYTVYEKDAVNKEDLYFVLNEVYLFAQNLLEESLQKDLNSLSAENYTGYDYLSDLLEEGHALEDLVQSSRQVMKHVESLKYDQVGWNQGSWYKNSGQELKKVVRDSSEYFNSYKDYLYFTTLPQNCRSVESQKQCTQNPHFDEVFTLLAVLSGEDEQGQKHFEKLTNKVFKDRKQDIQKLLEEVFQVIKVSPAASTQ